MQVSEIKYNNVLLASEFSENWKQIFIQGFNIAKQYKAKLTFLHVLNTEFIDLLIFDAGMERSSAIDKKFTMAKEFVDDAKKVIIKKLTDAFGEDIREHCNVLVERGNPVTTILKVAEEQECDLIVMGFKGRSLVGDTTMGSTVNKVLHKSKKPVMVVHNI